MESLINFLKSSRVKSFLWRSGMMIVAFACTAVAENLGILELSNTTTIGIGLFLSEVSKAINNSVSARQTS